MSTPTHRPSRPARWLALGVALALPGYACGPSALPAFANPPPDDAGMPRDASREDDAGAQPSAGTGR